VKIQKASFLGWLFVLIENFPRFKIQRHLGTESAVGFREQWF
jgi:hypothetical protein